MICSRMPGPDITEGIHPNQAEADYFRVPAWNNSTLRLFDTEAGSPMHVRHHLDTTDSSTSKAKERGHLAHLALLKPDEFRERAVQAPINKATDEPYGRNTKAWREFAADRPGKIILTREELADVGVMRHRLFSHEDARKLLECDGENEVVFRWSDSLTGLPCKGRIDRFTESGFVDLKTCGSAKWAAFQKSVVNFGYDTQAGMYQDGGKVLGLGAQQFWIVAIESEEPFAVSVFDMRAWFGIGMGIFQRRMMQAKECVTLNQWPGYGNKSILLPVPTWYESIHRRDQE